jgi:hypothetical protein
VVQVYFYLIIFNYRFDDQIKKIEKPEFGGPMIVIDSALLEFALLVYDA